VTDTGIGVPSGSDNALFTPFTQLDNFTTKRYKGTGLGLSICKSLAELMGGIIGYHPNRDQNGSVFYFTSTFSKLEVTASPTIAAVVPAEDLKSLAPTKTLLLVEDNAINQTIMVKLLRGYGFDKIDVASDGAEGVKMIKQKPLTYSLVLMDISMPVMDGVTATKHIRSSGHQIPIVAMTANALKGDEEAYLSAGMNDYVAKPVDRKLLMQTLLRWLG
jgi:osomolarity two-component system sensor histidine kinase TcsA